MDTHLPRSINPNVNVNMNTNRKVRSLHKVYSDFKIKKGSREVSVKDLSRAKINVLDREQLYEENLQLKQENGYLKNMIKKLKTQVNMLRKEINKKQSETSNNPNKLLEVLKNSNRELKTLLDARNGELVALKSSLKYSKLSETNQKLKFFESEYLKLKKNMEEAYNRRKRSMHLPRNSMIMDESFNKIQEHIIREFTDKSAKSNQCRKELISKIGRKSLDDENIEENAKDSERIDKLRNTEKEKQIDKKTIKIAIVEKLKGKSKSENFRQKSNLRTKSLIQKFKDNASKMKFRIMSSEESFLDRNADEDHKKSFENEVIEKNDSALSEIDQKTEIKPEVCEKANLYLSTNREFCLEKEEDSYEIEQEIRDVDQNICDGTEIECNENKLEERNENKLDKRNENKSDKRNENKLDKRNEDKRADIFYEILCKIYSLRVPRLEAYLQEVINIDRYTANDLVSLFSDIFTLENEEDRILIAEHLIAVNCIDKESLISKLLEFLKDWTPFTITEPSLQLKTAINFSHERLITILESKASNAFLPLRTIISVFEEYSLLLSESDKQWLMAYFYSLNQSVYRVPYARAITGLIENPLSSRASNLESTRNFGSSRTTSMASIDNNL